MSRKKFLPLDKSLLGFSYDGRPSPKKLDEKEYLDLIKKQGFETFYVQYEDCGHFHFVKSHSTLHVKYNLWKKSHKTTISAPYVLNFDCPICINLYIPLKIKNNLPSLFEEEKGTFEAQLEMHILIKDHSVFDSHFIRLG